MIGKGSRGSSPGRCGERMVFSGGVSFLCGLSVFRYPFHPRVTAVARKDPGHSAEGVGGIQLRL